MESRRRKRVNLIRPDRRRENRQKIGGRRWLPAKRKTEKPVEGADRQGPLNQSDWKAGERKKNKEGQRNGEGAIEKERKKPIMPWKQKGWFQ